MFRRIFVEKEISSHPRVQGILRRFDRAPVFTIDRVEDVFQRVRKPYLLKRTDLDLILGRKRGRLLRDAPDSYGMPGRPHYCLTHLYNCAFECAYCYLQGYFHSPDMVFHVNVEAFAREMEQISRSSPSGARPWFHAGEYGDSLALAHVTGELPVFFETMAGLPEATLELRTKSANIDPVLQMSPLPNVITSFTLAPEQHKERYEPKTPPLSARIEAMAFLAGRGYPVGVHLDPIIYQEDLERDYATLLADLSAAVDPGALAYVTLGALRFSKQAFNQVLNNYPQSALLAAEFVAGADAKVRYSRPMRLWMLNRVRGLCTDAGVDPDRIFTCMELHDREPVPIGENSA